MTLCKKIIPQNKQKLRSNLNVVLQYADQNWHVAHKYGIVKKSIIFGDFDQVSKKLAKICGFFNNGIFLGHMSILGLHAVEVNIYKKIFFMGI